MPRSTCPKTHPKDSEAQAYRVFAQTTSPKSQGGTGRSTNVNLPAVFCGELKVEHIDGRLVGVYRLPRGSHGVVTLDPHLFAAKRRQAVSATTKAHPEWKAGKVAAPAKAKAKAKAPRKPKAAPKATPKVKARPVRRAGPSRAVPAVVETPTAAAEPSGPVAEPVLTEAGERIANGGSS